MALLVFSVVVVCLAVAGLGLSWKDRHARRRSDDRDSQVIMTAPKGLIPADPDSEREEISLAQRLISGSLTPARYRLLMAGLAAQDARSHPLIVRSDRGWPA